MSYVRATVIDPNPGGSTRKQAILDLDTDTTGIFANLNTHEALTATHGATGAIVGTTNTQTLTNKTLTAPTLTTPSIGVASATSVNKVAITAPATSATLTIADGKTLTVSEDCTFTKGLTVSTNSGTLAFSGASKTLTIPDTLTLSQAGILALLNPTASRILGKKATGDSGELTGAETRAILGTSPFVLGSDADGDMYYRASSALARLAKGAGNTKLFMNAGATAPEWAVGHKVINATHACNTASGHFHVSGFNFQPSLVEVMIGIDGYPIVSLGWSDGTSHFQMYNAHLFAATAWYVDTTNIGAVVQSGSDSVTFTFGAWESDGLRVDFVKAGSPSGTAEMSFKGHR